jgi:hypothetical protein
MGWDQLTEDPRVLALKPLQVLYHGLLCGPGAPLQRSFSAIILEWLPTDTNSSQLPSAFDTGGKLACLYSVTLACMLISKHMWLIWKKSLRVSLGPLMAVTILFVIFHQPQTYAGDICRPATASLSTVSTPKMVWTTTFFCRGSICSPPRHASQTRIRRVKDA